jgi:hypothetical protein
VVFPGQRLVFEAMPKALLEIHTGMMASAIISDTIPCERLIMEMPDGNANSADSEEESQVPGESPRETVMAGIVD